MRRLIGRLLARFRAAPPLPFPAHLEIGDGPGQWRITGGATADGPLCAAEARAAFIAAANPANPAVSIYFSENPATDASPFPRRVGHRAPNNVLARHALNTGTARATRRDP